MRNTHTIRGETNFDSLVAFNNRQMSFSNSTSGYTSITLPFIDDIIVPQHLRMESMILLQYFKIEKQTSFVVNDNRKVIVPRSIQASKRNGASWCLSIEKMWSLVEIRNCKQTVSRSVQASKRSGLSQFSEIEKKRCLIAFRNRKETVSGSV